MECHGCGHELIEADPFCPSLAHYTVGEVNADVTRLTKTDPQGYTRFLLTGQYSTEVTACFRT